MSASMLRAIQRHRELHQDNTRELKRTKVWLYNRDYFALLMPRLWNRRMSNTPLTKQISYLACVTISSAFLCRWSWIVLNYCLVHTSLRLRIPCWRNAVELTVRTKWRTIYCSTYLFGTTTNTCYWCPSNHRQAYETRSEFSRQRTSLAGINNRMVQVIGVLLVSCSWFVLFFSTWNRYNAWYQQPCIHD